MRLSCFPARVWMKFDDFFDQKEKFGFSVSESCFEFKNFPQKAWSPIVGCLAPDWIRAKTSVLTCHNPGNPFIHTHKHFPGLREQYGPCRTPLESILKTILLLEKSWPKAVLKYNENQWKINTNQWKSMKSNVSYSPASRSQNHFKKRNVWRNCAFFLRDENRFGHNSKTEMRDRYSDMETNISHKQFWFPQLSKWSDSAELARFLANRVLK